MGIEKYGDNHDYDHDKDCGHDRDRDRDDGKDDDKERDYCKCKKERAEYKKERDEYRRERDDYKKEREDWKKKAYTYKKELYEYKAFVNDALERLGIAARKLDHLQHDLVDAAGKLGKHHGHDKGDCKDDDKEHDKG